MPHKPHKLPASPPPQHGPSKADGEKRSGEGSASALARLRSQEKAKAQDPLSRPRPRLR